MACQAKAHKVTNGAFSFIHACEQDMVLELLEGLQGKAGQDRAHEAVVEDFSTCVKAATKLADKDSIAALALAGKVCSSA